MARLLYVFPHPDDESFGPASAISGQIRSGNEVHLLTLTRGGATKARFVHNYSVAEMGEVRYREMLCVERVLGLSGMTVLDYPDGALADCDPRELEGAVANEIRTVQPAVVITYPVHGISGFHDHLVCHAVVKRVFVELREANPWLKRLAFFAINRDIEGYHRLQGSSAAAIDCVQRLEQADHEKLLEALSCYRTYQETIEKTGVKELQSSEAYFEIFQEDFKPPLSWITEQL